MYWNVVNTVLRQTKNEPLLKGGFIITLLLEVSCNYNWIGRLCVFYETNKQEQNTTRQVSIAIAC